MSGAVAGISLAAEAIGTARAAEAHWAREQSRAYWIAARATADRAVSLHGLVVAFHRAARLDPDPRERTLAAEEAERCAVLERLLWSEAGQLAAQARRAAAEAERAMAQQREAWAKAARRVDAWHARQLA